LHCVAVCPYGWKESDMLQNARQHLEKQLRPLVQQWDDTKQKLRALARQT